MSYLTGRDGKLLLDGKAVAKVRDWSLRTSVEALNATTLIDADERVTPGLKGKSGSCTILWYQDSPAPFLQRVMKQGFVTDNDKVALQLGFGNGHVTIGALLTEVSLSMTTGEVFGASVQFTGDGDYISYSYEASPTSSKVSSRTSGTATASGGIVTGITPPGGGKLGDIWVNTGVPIPMLFVYDGTNWKQVVQADGTSIVWDAQSRLAVGDVTATGY